MTVYFAEEIGTGHIKIGYTSSTYPQSDRIDPSLTMTSLDLAVRAELDANRETEQLLHQAFGRWRITRNTDERGVYSNTEFFRPSAELWSLIGYIQREHKLPCHPLNVAKLIWHPELKPSVVHDELRR